MTTYLVVISDSHAGHKLGLCSPEVKLQEEDQSGRIVEKPAQLSAFQEYLWGEVYIPAVDTITSITRGHAVVLMHMGDMTHGDGHAEELMSTRIENQIRIGVANMRPLMEMPGVVAMRAAYGTGVHEFGEGSGALLITDMLKVMYTGIDSANMYHGLAEIEGAGVDYAHHGPGPGLRSWLRGNVAQIYLRDLMFEEILQGKLPPALVLRGHVHEYVNVMQMLPLYGSEVWSRLVVLPSMCGLGDYGRKATRSEFILRNGLMLFAIENTMVVDAVPFFKTLDLRTKEKII